MRWMFAHKSFLDYGIPVAPASDYTPGPYEPLMAIQSMVTRKDFDGRIWGPNQRISIEDALKICTINGAYASFEEGIKGSITTGKLADFVILAMRRRMLIRIRSNTSKLCVPSWEAKPCMEHNPAKLRRNDRRSGPSTN